MSSQTIPTWTLGDRLAKARHHVGLTVREMAFKLGVSKNTVSNWETGATRPRRYAIEAWARATGVDLDWLEGPRVPDDIESDQVKRGFPGTFIPAALIA